MNDSDVIKTFETSWSKRFFVLGAALMVAVLIGIVGWAFHGRNISRSAAALTPITAPASPSPAQSP